MTQLISLCKPTESGNYLTNMGWAYFDLKEGVFLDSGEEIEVEWFDDGEEED